jgi:hypothetical protein
VPEHPLLHAGYNFDDINGDEIDGAGTNWTVWPVLFDAYIGHVPLIVTDEMMSVFDEACADFTPAHIDTTTTLPPPERVTEIQSNGWRMIMVASEGNVITIRQTPREKVIRDIWGEETLPVQGDQVLPRAGANTVRVRKRQ